MKKENQLLSDEIGAAVDGWYAKGDPSFITAALSSLAIENAIRCGLPKDFILAGMAETYDQMAETCSDPRLRRVHHS